MKVLLSLLLFTLYTAVLSQASSTPPDTTESSTLVTESTTLTTEPTTLATEPTTLSTETSTSEQVTTTMAPPTTTVLSTTSSSETTTDAKSTTRQPVTTSSPVTTAIPAPEKCSWNKTCIRADLKVQFTIPNEDKKSYINLGCGSLMETDCSLNETQTLFLVEPNQYNLTMVFEKDGDKFFVRNITFDYSLLGGENGSVASTEKLFNVKVGNSYLCRSETPVHLENVTMEISEIHIQAFVKEGEENFGSAEECEADDKVSDVVPIAVGIALAALIIIVLIGYLVGRRRSRQRGYQSV